MANMFLLDYTFLGSVWTIVCGVEIMTPVFEVAGKTEPQIVPKES